MVAIEQDEAFWYQYWVAGGDSFLTSNKNTGLGLANGTFAKNHSLTFASKYQTEAIKKYVAQSKLPFGSEIELSQPPLSVNFEIMPALDGKRPPTKRQRQLRALRRLSLFPDSEKIVIPLTKDSPGGPSKTSSTNKWRTYRFRAPQGHGHAAPVSSVQIRECFSYEPAYSATVHRAQGRTLSNVVLALSRNPKKSMEFASMFVAMSRVKSRDKLRILRHTSGPLHEVPAAFGYILNLIPNRFVVQYYSGFKNDVGLWDKDLALQSVF
jgi:hypothetical protein